MFVAFICWFYSGICRWPKPPWLSDLVSADGLQIWMSTLSSPPHTAAHCLSRDPQSDPLSAEHILEQKGQNVTQHLLTCSPMHPATVHMQIKDSTRFLLVKESHYFARTPRSWIKLKCIFSSRKVWTWEKKVIHLFYLRLTSYFPQIILFRLFKRAKMCPGHVGDNGLLSSETCKVTWGEPKWAVSFFICLFYSFIQ